MDQSEKDMDDAPRVLEFLDNLHARTHDCVDLERAPHPGGRARAAGALPCAIAAGTPSPESAPVSGARSATKANTSSMVLLGAQERWLIDLLQSITSDTPLKIFKVELVVAAARSAPQSTCVAPQRCFCWRLLFLPPAYAAALFLPPACAAAARATEPRHHCSFAPGRMLLVRATPCAHP